MFPWKDTLHSWADSAQFQLNALGLINILGTDEVDASVGRLVPSRYTDLLPLLGPFILASNQFAKRQPNFTLYNLTDRVMTTELSGWLSRWLKSQDFHKIHHEIRWEVRESSVSTFSRMWTALAVSIPCHGFLVAITVLSADWWGFVNVLAMMLSVAVRLLLVWQHRAGIDAAIDNKQNDKGTGDLADHKIKQQPGTDTATEVEEATRERCKDSKTFAKVIIVMDDSKVITMNVPRHLVRPVFTQIPTLPYPSFYRYIRWVGWAAYAAHIVSIGMALLPTQIFTVCLILASTILTTFKFGCDDWRMVTHIDREVKTGHGRAKTGVSCLISSRLEAICSQYPEQYDEWIRNYDKRNAKANVRSFKDTSSNNQDRPKGEGQHDLEAQNKSSGTIRPSGTTRRRDLFIWLDLTENELELMKMWNLTPHGESGEWWREFYAMRKQWQSDHMSRITIHKDAPGILLEDNQ